LQGISLILDSGSPWLAVLLAVAANFFLRIPWQALLLMAVVFVPAAVAAAAKLEGGVSLSVALERDYMPALVCHLMAWTAALLPLVVLRSITGPLPSIPQIILLIAVLIYFLGLSVCAIRTIGGTSFPRASAALVIALVAAVAGGWLLSFAGRLAYIFLSPWVLYYLYMRFGSEARSLGGGLSSRQRMHQLLDTATVNPQDADARYQLGLIYQQRRDLARAKQYFRNAIRIDASEPDAHYQLGRILRSEGDPAGAMEELETAAAIDDKHSSSEVWREIGAACLELNQNQRARDIFAIYTQRRPFDAEGLYWYGLALSRMGQTKEAQEALESAKEAVRTAPPHRRRQIRQWEGLAKKQLRELS
jgi:Tfp pilus assembly protein PilF